MVQWDSMRNPAICVGYFHWSLLANVDVAVPLLSALGGGNWCRFGFKRLAGNELGQQRLQSDGAVEVYASLFEKEETLRHTCKDFAGAVQEHEEQVADQKAGKRIEVPVMVMFSQANQGMKIDYVGAWKEFIAPGVSLKPVPVGQGYGHFLPEEAHDVVSVNILSFLDTAAATA